MTTSPEKQVELVEATRAMELCAAAMQTLSVDDEALLDVRTVYQAAATVLAGTFAAVGVVQVDDRVPVPIWLTEVRIEVPDAS